MDSKSIVYYAARDGNLGKLKSYLQCNKGKYEVSMLVGAKTRGATPLVIACRNGHYDVAEYLIEKCQADLEQPGSVMFDGETIEGAPPLWCAAAAGHLAIVKLLILHGAKVNTTTRTNSTPLRAACFDGHLDIVQYLVQHGADIEVANRHGHTCLMIACYKGHLKIAKYLLGLNADVNKKSVKGNTALHDCAESGSLEALKLLLEHGAKMDVDSYGMTPLMAAAVTGHKEIVEYLIEIPDLVSRRERIDALELLGATRVDRKRDMLGAIDLWKRALMERYYQDGVGEAIPKPHAQKIAAYDNVTEIDDLEGLDDLLADPDRMRMQALVIRERILGPAHPDTSYFIRYRGAVYADAGKFDRCIELWNYALDMQQKVLERLNPMTQSSLYGFTELFSFMMCEEGKHRGARALVVPSVDAREILRVFKKAVKEVESGSETVAKLTKSKSESDYLTRVMFITLHLACLLTRLLDHQVNDDERMTQDIYRAIYDLVKLKAKAKGGRTVLHLACCKDTALFGRYPACEFPSTHLTRVLLKVGADPNERDDDGNAALHLAASSKAEAPPPVDLIRLLLAEGAHIDATNAEGATFADLLQDQPVHRYVNTVEYTRLSCACARVIRQFKIPYRGVVPARLDCFIASH
ncbi:unnamed protein product [Phyllotreta striolata]|uniref:Protein fem-1 homolog CG6966 n=1 Tax=Phyllotreta striolata TaxID=444603 RepID=A0A9N9TEQ2_PHYSR|nr:unnamed protein product [Phyllotreta striolata]